MDTLFAWLTDLGIRLDDHEPDARQLAHMAAVREAKRQAIAASSPLTRLARRLGIESIGATTSPIVCPCQA